MKTLAKEDIVTYKINKAKTTLNDVDFLIEHDFLDTAIDRIFHASFYAVTALLVQHNIDTKTHKDTRLMLSLHFIKPGILSTSAGSFYKHLSDKKLCAEYEDFIVLEKNEVTGLLLPAMNLVKEIEQIIANK